MSRVVQSLMTRQDAEEDEEDIGFLGRNMKSMIVKVGSFQEEVRRIFQRISHVYCDNRTAATLTFGTTVGPLRHRVPVLPFLPIADR